MKVLIVAGGTGGHFYPGLAVAKECIARGDQVHFVVRHEDKVIPWLEREKIPFSTIHAGGFMRRLSPQLGKSLFSNVRGFCDVFPILKRENPNVVMAMGGYLSFPVGLAAWFEGIPVILHEQNAVPGLANKALSRLAKKVAVTFPESEKIFPGKAIYTGNPVRPEFLSPIDRIEALNKWNFDPAKKTFLIFGGSLGARRLNELVTSLLVSSELKEDWQFLHFTGDKLEQAVKDAYVRSGARHYVAAYCHEMALAYSAADLIICRAGASTVSEILVTKKPALFVPYPQATNQHQLANAKVLVNAGVAEVREERELNFENMQEIVLKLVQPQRLSELKMNFEKLSLDFSSSAKLIREILVREVNP